MTSELTELIN